jgi:hypothetical protein
MSSNPTLRIGVTGHRVPPKLPHESVAPLREQLGRLFADLIAATGQAGSDFAIVSSLAEGADRIVSDAGLAAGFSLEAVLPLARLEYEKDFETETSRAEFRQLLARAAIVRELDGLPEQRPRAYEAAGLFMLANIEALVAIWNGEPAAGVGGTEEIVNRACADGLLVIWIEPIHPQAIKIYTSLSSGEAPKKEFHPADIATTALALKSIIATPGR